MEIHAGSVVEKVVRSSGISIAELARRVKVDRRSLYNWFEQKDLKLEAIARIGYVLGYDFSMEFPELKSVQKMLEVNRLEDSNDGGYFDDTEYWKQKYVTLLEKYNELLSKRMLLAEESAA